MRYLIPLILLVSGCESIQYRGASPNVRSFSEDPRLNQYYIGVDFEFAVVDPDVDADKPEKEQASAAPLFPEDPGAIPKPLPEPNIPW